MVSLNINLGFLSNERCAYLNVHYLSMIDNQVNDYKVNQVNDYKTFTI